MGVTLEQLLKGQVMPELNDIDLAGIAMGLAKLTGQDIKEPLVDALRRYIPASLAATACNQSWAQFQPRFEDYCKPNQHIFRKSIIAKNRQESQLAPTDLLAYLVMKKRGVRNESARAAFGSYNIKLKSKMPKNDGSKIVRFINYAFYGKKKAGGVDEVDKVNASDALPPAAQPFADCIHLPFPEAIKKVRSLGYLKTTAILPSDVFMGFVTLQRAAQMTEMTLPEFAAYFHTAQIADEFPTSGRVTGNDTYLVAKIDLLFSFLQEYDPRALTNHKNPRALRLLNKNGVPTDTLNHGYNLLMQAAASMKPEPSARVGLQEIGSAYQLPRAIILELLWREPIRSQLDVQNGTARRDLIAAYALSNGVKGLKFSFERQQRLLEILGYNKI